MRNDGVALKIFKEKKREKGEIKKQRQLTNITQKMEGRNIIPLSKKNMVFFFNVRLFLIVYFLFMYIYI
jgi:hypothetical protein